MSNPKIFEGKTFGSYVCMGDTVETVFAGFTITATLYQDEDSTPPDQRQDGFWPSLNKDDAGWIGDNPTRPFEEQHAHAARVMRLYQHGDWGYCGVAVTVSRDGIELTGQYQHSVWGCDYNYPCYDDAEEKTRHDYLMEYAEDLAREAINEATEKANSLAPVSDAVENCHRYSAALDEMGIAPNGDDFNALLALLDGAEYAPPHKGGR